jgi:hypothetical protein
MAGALAFLNQDKFHALRECSVSTVLVLPFIDRDLPFLKSFEVFIHPQPSSEKESSVRV